MTDDADLPRAGDIVWVDLRPTLGREQSGVRPAIVLSDFIFHRQNETAIVCPITRNVNPWPTKVLLPDGLAVAGAVLVDQVRCVDRASRGFRRVGSVPDHILLKIRLNLAEVLGIAADVPSRKDA
ncbi:mRNA-degrading endonuclease toxin of MazEF toxin-antitoxin module [Methylobacterium sp. BE186]|uniref:type II toxin-antitoxin system PemK/MazF family toxin n=1 Tax=Methylobacterium sp. BE186 TaxID=2817715 RepID=UPI00285F8FDB|nr:type II toxin-antitoxin system PemK/MazF family toxin [Methylobacterium sp. BE186]MDR7037562.1 mRNA-degrading endonuclease toxin of MazEF toxin-antitoxin module [Methylobacterium sp. BE186]